MEASATTTASFRIIIPFPWCHYGQRKLTIERKVSAQARKNIYLLHNSNNLSPNQPVMAHGREHGVQRGARLAVD
ncbi:hypothetical protein, partial [Novosphingobium sp. UBA1939]|uniref:hypothetical protein n=1 Tax=Novosphingobium sp. UBA1939 TaxID=1946982 RepID=UPI0025FA5780